jgi:hypothetical protein
MQKAWEGATGCELHFEAVQSQVLQLGAWECCDWDAMTAMQLETGQLVWSVKPCEHALQLGDCC